MGTAPDVFVVSHSPANHTDRSVDASEPGGAHLSASKPPRQGQGRARGATTAACSRSNRTRRSTAVMRMKSDVARFAPKGRRVAMHS
jgi:hypothetical protein